MFKLFPEFFVDGVIDIEKVKLFFNIDNENKYTNFGLFWDGKNEVYKNLINSSISTSLIPNFEKSQNFLDSKNLYIVGDNLSVLKLLQKHYYNQIDVIYIDPPYNTGHDFIYNDNFKENKKDYLNYLNKLNSEDGSLKSNINLESGRFHTNWLNMIFPRLLLARETLKKTGCILISIDDNELYNLKLVCDEVFGQENFIGNIVWIRNPGGKSDSKFFAETKEYILVYSKNINCFKLNVLKKEQELKNTNYDSVNNCYWKKGNTLAKGGSNDLLIDRKNLGYVIYFNKKENDIKIKHDYNINVVQEYIEKKEKIPLNIKIYNLDESLIKDGYQAYIPRKIKDTYGRWRMGPEKVLNLFKENRLIFENDNVYEKEVIFNDNPYKEFKAKDLIDWTTNQKATIHLRNMDLTFSNPKPVELIKHLLFLTTEKDSLILDFFSGSGTTAEAIMELNEEDNGNRKFILVQLPEKSLDNDKDIISDIGINRIMKSFESNSIQKSLKVLDTTNWGRNSLDDLNLFNLNQNIDYLGIWKLFYEILIVNGYSLNDKINQKYLENNKILLSINDNQIFFVLDNFKENEWKNIFFEIRKSSYLDKIYVRDSIFQDDNQKEKFVNEARKELNLESKLVFIN